MHAKHLLLKSGLPTPHPGLGFEEMRYFLNDFVFQNFFGITIRIVDSNDNAPVFTKPTYFVEIEEVSLFSNLVLRCIVI